MRYAIIVSRFNEVITQKLEQGAVAGFEAHGIDSSALTIYHVPGAIEIPLIAKLLAISGQYHAIVALGAVIRGETTHYDYVCEQVNRGCQEVMLEFNLPVIFGVLTTETEEQAQERTGGKHGHKGYDAAIAAIEMATLVATINSNIH